MDKSRVPAAFPQVASKLSQGKELVMIAAGLEQFPDESRLWVFEANGVVDDSHKDVLQERIGSFLTGWVAHGSGLKAGWELRYDRFLMIAVDEGQTSASGCSIDSLTRFVTILGNELGVSFLDRNAVSHRGGEGETIARNTRQAFKELVTAGVLTGDTIVFDNTVSHLGAVRRGEWELPAKNSWHSVFFA